MTVESSIANDGLRKSFRGVKMVDIEDFCDMTTVEARG